MTDVELAFLRDLVLLLREKADSTRSDAATGDKFDLGRNFTMHEVLDLVLSQARAFNLNLPSIALDGFDPWSILVKGNSN
jgi:hypothetical protein